MGAQDTTCIYFAGAGLKDEESRGYLVVMESREKVQEKLWGSTAGAFVRLTTLNGRSIWLNPTMIVAFTSSGVDRPTPNIVHLDEGLTEADFDVIPVSPIDVPVDITPEVEPDVLPPVA